ncbi:MAG: glycosyltransferase [Patescibacteria group bacterium]
MKVLQINKFLYPRGGAESYLFALTKLLVQHGHEVIFFSQKNRNNLENNQKKYFISEINLDKFHFKNIFKIGRIFWSFCAKRKIKKLINQEKPDLVHIHNIYHQISPSILPIIKEAGIPIVMTVHDFKLVRHDYTLRADEKRVKAKNSRLTDWLLRLEFNFHKTLKIYQKNIDLFIAPSQFVKKQLILAGFDKNKIEIIPHPVDLKNGKTQKTKENYILFFGRLDESKGAEILIRAYSQIKNKTARLKIAGSGPQENQLIILAKQLGLDKKVEFLGAVDKTKLARVIKGAKFTVFPSLVHETFGLGVIESYAAGKPVIASRAGAFSELVKHQKTGMLVKPGDILALKKAIEYLLQNPKPAKTMGKNAKKEISKYSPAKHYQKIIKFYKKLSAKRIKAAKPGPIFPACLKRHPYLVSPLPPKPFKGEKALAITVAILIIILAGVSIWQTTKKPTVQLPQRGAVSGLEEIKYPRIANLYWKTPITKDEAEKLARYDLIALDMNAQITSAENIKSIRKLNPQIIILAYASSNEIPAARLSEVEPSGVGLWHDLISGVKYNWLLRTYEGNSVSWWPGNISMNLYTKDNQSKTYGDYLVDFYDQKILATGLWDGLLLDNIWQDISWVDRKIDIDGDGQPDSEEKINQLWQESHRDFFQKLRVRLGDRYLIVGNGVGEYQPWTNGRMLENFPEIYENGWVGSMTNYLKNNSTGYNPRVNIVNSDSRNSGNDENYQKMRFGLASALLGDGFYTFNYGPALREDFWWYDEYDLDLGEPKSGPINLLDAKNKKIKAGVWQRNFESGKVLVNSTDRPQTVKIEGGYRRLYGSQDMETNNAESAKIVTLKAQDGLILIKE